MCLSVCNQLSDGARGKIKIEGNYTRCCADKPHVREGLQRVIVKVATNCRSLSERAC